MVGFVLNIGDEVGLMLAKSAIDANQILTGKLLCTSISNTISSASASVQKLLMCFRLVQTNELKNVFFAVLHLSNQAL